MMWIIIVIAAAAVLALHVARRCQQANGLIDRILLEELGTPATAEAGSRQPSPFVAKRSPTAAHR